MGRFNNRSIIEYCEKKKIEASSLDLTKSREVFVKEALASEKLKKPQNLSIDDEIISFGISLQDQDKMSTKDFLSDMKQIQKILENEAIVNAQLAKLENGLKQLSCSLMVFLYKWSIENGFSHKWIRVTGFLNTDIFLAILKEKQLMKDYGPDILHGEFSHALQIYILCEANKDHHYIKTPIADIYARIGSNDCKSSIKVGRTLWDLIFDRALNETCPAYDARSPERLMTYIETRREDYPLLSAALRKKYVLIRNGIFKPEGIVSEKLHLASFDKKAKLHKISK